MRHLSLPLVRSLSLALAACGGASSSHHKTTRAVIGDIHSGKQYCTEAYDASASPAFELFHVRLLAPLYAVTGELLTRVQGAHPRRAGADRAPVGQGLGCGALKCRA